MLRGCYSEYVNEKKGFTATFEGMPMGSPTSGLIAKAVLQRLEAIVFQTDFHVALNNALPGIQFTLDKEKGSNSPFLDILIHRLSTCVLETSVHRKSILSDVVLNFLSNSPYHINKVTLKPFFSFTY